MIKTIKFPHDMSEAMERQASGIDKKLESTLDAFGTEMYLRSEENGAPPNLSRAIEQIKQAFIDDGWISPEKVNEIGEQQLDFGHRWGMMTGPEWLEQFEKQTQGRVWGFRNDDEKELVQDVCLYYERAARRASGLV